MSGYRKVMYSNTSGGEVKKIHIKTVFGSNIMDETQQNQVPFLVLKIDLNSRTTGPNSNKLNSS